MTTMVRKALAMGIATLALLFAVSPLVSAQQSSSTHYQVNEVFFGTGGELNACSSNYCSKQSAGETAVGNTASGNYQANAGFNTTDRPVLELNVAGGTFDLGILDYSSVHTNSTTFTIRSYLSSGYVVRLTGSTPVNSTGHSLPGMSSAATSSPGTEQFGVNLRANSSPSVGSDVQQVPDTTFGFGTPASGYNTINNFKFVNNDTIASSSKSSGTSRFTLSMIANVASTTPAGVYTGHLSVVAVPTF